MSDYPPSSVSFDVRFTVAPDDLARFVDELEEHLELLDDVEWSYPASPIVFGGDHRDEELADVFNRLSDNERAG